MKDEAYCPLYVQLKDKYGDNGLIAALVLKLEHEEIQILEWLMSCRVLARGVEEFTMNYVFALAAEKGLRRVVGTYRPTAKNQMVQDFFAKFGFEKTGEDADGHTVWAFETGAYRPRETFMECEDAAMTKELNHDTR